MHRIKLIVLASLLITCRGILAAEPHLRAQRALVQAGIDLQLKGDASGANAIAAQLKRTYPNDALGYVFNLNTLASELSWDETDTQVDKQILADAEIALRLCAARIERDPQDAIGYFQCGQTHFTLTYLHGARRNYYRAGTNGSDTIEFLEKALALDDQLTDAKLHLGAAYYFADNLPPFVRVFSRLLWFIPQGNSQKSLPYLEEVTVSGDLYRDVASYMYVWVLLRGDDTAKHEAGAILADLVQRFPQSRRFAMRYLSYLVAAGEFQEAVLIAQKFIDECPGCVRDPVDLDLARLWQARAFLAQADADGAERIVEQIQHPHAFPNWARGWHSLTLAQLKDIAPDRASATQMYQRVLDLRDTGQISQELERLALSGLAAPFSLNALAR